MICERMYRVVLHKIAPNIIPYTSIKRHCCIHESCCFLTCKYTRHKRKNMLYHQDQALLNTETNDSGYLEIIEKIQTDRNTEASTYSYQDENHVEQLIVYKYLEDRNWVFMVRDNEIEVYGSVMTVRILVGGLCAAMAIVVIYFISDKYFSTQCFRRSCPCG